MSSSKAIFREVGVVTIVDFGDLLTLVGSSIILRPATHELIGKQQSKIILDFRNVAAIDRAIAGKLVAFAALTNLPSCSPSYWVGRLRLARAKGERREVWKPINSHRDPTNCFSVLAKLSTWELGDESRT
jgi:hypothetical protein